MLINHWSAQFIDSDQLADVHLLGCVGRGVFVEHRRDTCTPYGINSHRMLVRGHRVETVVEKPKIEIAAEAEQIPEKTVIKWLAIPAGVLIFISLLFLKKKKRRML